MRMGFTIYLSLCLLRLCVHVNRCAAAYVLLAEEEATTITEAERLFKKALSIGKHGFEYRISAISSRRKLANYYESNYTQFKSC